MNIDLKYIEDQIREIGLADGDPEHQHSIEDGVYVAVLREIAKGAPNASELAAAALKIADMDFTRWYA